MPYSRHSIGSGFNRHSSLHYHDLEKVRTTPAAGLNNIVRRSFAEEISPVQAVGVMGWTFRQNGLNYRCRIRGENNENIYEFGLEIPKGQEYRHRSHTLGLAEKAHILMIVEQCLSPDKKRQHLSDLFELEKACFDPSAGIVTWVPAPKMLVFTTPGYVTGHCGFAFANDEISLELLKSEKKLKPVEPVVLLLEWDQDDKVYSIDCSGNIPRFQIGYVANPNMSKLNMTRGEAKNAVDYAQTKIKGAQPELAQLCAITGLWQRLEMTAEWLSMFRQPS